MEVLAKAETDVITALIAAGGALLVAIIAQVGNINARRRLKAIEDERAERNARRDYEYEALKRLYAQCEPLLFQATELAAVARRRVLSLARSAAGGDIRADGSGWLGEGYYFTSTAYQLLAPLTFFRLLQGRLTDVDFGLDARVRERYELLKLLFLSFNSDFELAKCHLRLEYDPDSADPGEPRRDELLRSSPQVYQRQGLYRGILDVVVESLIVDGSHSDSARCRSYGEFLREWDRRGSDVNAVRGEVEALLQGFHPARQPVLWRVLLSQYLLYSALLNEPPLSTEGPRLSDETIELFDWRSPEDEATDEDVRTPVAAAESYVSSRFDEIRLRLTPPKAP